MIDRPEFFNGVPIPYGASVAQLLGMIESSGPEKWAAIVALAHCDADEALHLLANLAQSSDTYTRRAAIVAIGRHARGHVLGQLVCKRLEDSSEYVAWAACEAAAALKLRAAHGGIQNLLKHRSQALRLAAVQALAVLWRNSDFSKVFQLMQSDPADKVRKEAAWTLRKRARRSNWRLLFDTWRREHPPRHRVWACELAETFGASEILPFLAQLAADRDGHVRKAAGRAIDIIQERPPGTSLTD